MLVATPKQGGAASTELVSQLAKRRAAASPRITAAHEGVWAVNGQEHSGVMRGSVTQTSNYQVFLRRGRWAQPGTSGERSG
jgi:hypothetical protein